MNKILTGDALKLLGDLDNESVDLVIADPPYGIDKDFGNGEEWHLGDHNSWFDWQKRWLDEIPRVLKSTGSIFIYGIHHNIGYVQTYLYELGLNYGRLFIWHYENGWSKYSKSPAATYEPLLWFYKDSYTYNEIREPYKSQDRLKHKIIKNGKVWIPNPEGKRGGDIWKVPTLAGRRFANEKVEHPTQKPLALCDKIIRHFSNPDDLVLVPFVGSGSECVSAKRLGRQYLGFELNKRYVAIAEQRLAEVERVSTVPVLAKG